MNHPTRGLYGSCLFLLVLLISSCTANVKTTVSTFRSASPLPENGLVHILPRLTQSNEAIDELEFAFFAEKLASQLTVVGLTQGNADNAGYIAYLEYDTVRQKKSRTNGHLHGSVGYHYGYGSVVVADGYNREQFEFARRVKVTLERITKHTDNEKLLSLSAVSYGKCEHLASVYDEMLTAIFDNLHSPSGSVITTTIKNSQPCTG